ncbi:MAG: hypothetical protein EDS66_05720 [Planctomycetota bacterium]|nr:MAG: hypothetical protein EDS66_05720 [Planctomycetota bacterium]MCQ3922543.1 hypothetical protein [Planctomycetota bacterium]
MLSRTMEMDLSEAVHERDDREAVAFRRSYQTMNKDLKCLHFYRCGIAFEQGSRFRIGRHLFP